jgi:hypothetical protein
MNTGWKIFFAVFMIWMAKNCAAYMSRADVSQMKDYGPSMTYKNYDPATNTWDPNRNLR